MSEEKRNKSQSYYIEDNSRNESIPFQLNCVGEVVLKKKFKSINAQGRNDYYLMYIRGGELEATVGGEDCVLREGDVICIRPGTPYTYNNYACSRVIRYYWMHFTGGECERVLNECGVPVGRCIALGNSHETAFYFEDLFTEFGIRRTNLFFSAALKAQYLLLYIGRTVVRENDRDSVRLERSIRYIHTHIKQPLTVKQLADMEYLSQSRYRELFRAVTGHSPIEYITWQRVHLACELIEQGDMSLASVAETCGFADRMYFQRVFKRVMKMTPGQFKRGL
ncbi:MAG: AraC family transcriptional regulator [Clostridia bacterium]|nr:AraC family transcriptional regulator [Clostridia bacterium]